MRKEVQRQINMECDIAWDFINREMVDNVVKFVSHLRYCKANVYETKNYYILRSYNTFVAAIDKRTDTLIDMLRYVYGYTTTSAQHITKFSQDYGQGKWGCINILRYYPIS